jgi:ketopantoate reductase
VARGRALGVPTPVNAALAEMIRFRAEAAET